MRTASIVLIGDELLSGKVQDTNATYLIGRLRGLGVSLRSVRMVPDVREEIERAVREAAERTDVVFTSGGVGPTHDDITLESIASAFGVTIERHPDLETLLRDHFGARLTPDHLRMADLPVGAELVYGGELRWPVTRFRNVYVLPGVPEIFRHKFEAIAEQFRDGRFYLRSVYLDDDEGRIAETLRALQAQHQVSVGSYPRIDRRTDHRLRITIEARTPGPVDAATEALLAAVDPKRLVRVDPPVAPTADEG